MEEQNNEMLNFELDTIDKKCEEAAAQIASYKLQAARYYNKKFWTRTFQVSNWVLRKVFQNRQERGTGKLGPNWEEPYGITRIVGNGALQTENTSTIVGTPYIFADIMFEQTILSFFTFYKILSLIYTILT